MLLMHLKNKSGQKRGTGQKKRHRKWEAKKEVMLVLIKHYQVGRDPYSGEDKPF